MFSINRKRKKQWFIQTKKTKKIKCLSFHAIEWFFKKNNLNVSLFELRAKDAKEYCVTCLLVILQKTNKLKILKNNHFSIHTFFFWH